MLVHLTVYTPQLNGPLRQVVGLQLERPQHADNLVLGFRLAQHQLVGHATYQVQIIIVPTILRHPITPRACRDTAQIGRQIRL